MHQAAKLQKWLPIVWIVLAAVIVGAEYFTGPLISFSIVFVVPVALAAWLSGRWWGIALGVLMPLGRLSLTFHWKMPWTLADSLINAGIRMVVLVAFAVLIDHVTRQAREIRVLRGLLPVCGFCKKIRTEDQTWQPIESYISERSHASFTHTVCPECGKQHYGEYFDQIMSRQSKAAQGTPKEAR